MLKVRIIPVLTYNGFGLVKTKKFNNPRMVGNPVQSARVFNSRGVDELIFVDICASKQERKINLSVVREVLKECFMPVGVGGGVSTIQDVSDLLKIGADKVVIKSAAICNVPFIEQASRFFGAQCITISVDAILNNNQYFIYNQGITGIKVSEFLRRMEDKGAGEIILNSVDNDGEMNGFDIDLFKIAEDATSLPIVMVGGGGNLNHYKELFSQTNCEAVGSSSIFHFTQFTPLDIKLKLGEIGKPIRF
jgi:imidazole glycerol-phosphate synthase subunit HisF